MRSFLFVQYWPWLGLGVGGHQRKTEAQPECVCQLQGKAPGASSGLSCPECNAFWKETGFPLVKRTEEKRL